MVLSLFIPEQLIQAITGMEKKNIRRVFRFFIVPP
jgi:hypothetical protein